MLTAGRARWIALCLLVLQVAVSTEVYDTALSGLSDADAVRQTGDLRPKVTSIAFWLMLAALSHLPAVLHVEVGLRCAPADCAAADGEMGASGPGAGLDKSRVVRSRRAG